MKRLVYENDGRAAFVDYAYWASMAVMVAAILVQANRLGEEGRMAENPTPLTKPARSTLCRIPQFMPHASGGLAAKGAGGAIRGLIDAVAECHRPHRHARNGTGLVL